MHGLMGREITLCVEVSPTGGPEGFQNCGAGVRGKKCYLQAPEHTGFEKMENSRLLPDCLSYEQN